MLLRVATLNVWGLPEPFARDVEARIEAIGERLPSLHLDLMAFQEVWISDLRDRLISAGRRAGLRHAWHHRATLGGGGLLVLSRLPVEDVRFDRFALRGHPEQIAQGEYLGGKGFVRLRVATAAGPLTFVDTHLHARYAQQVAHQYRPLRTAQVVQLTLRSRESTEPVVVAGDFNFREGDPEYAIFTGLASMRDLAAELDRRQPTVFRANPYRTLRNKPERRVDFLFARDGRDRGIRARSVERIFDGVLELDGGTGSYSNHAGVLAEIEITGRPDALVSVPDRGALFLAARLLAQGRREAERRRSGGRAWAGFGIGCAALASAGSRSPGISRRRLLRASLDGAALIALTPAVGFSVLSEWLLPDEIRAFDEAAARLALLERNAAGPMPS